VIRGVVVGCASIIARFVAGLWQLQAMRFLVIACFALFVPACSPCALGFCSDVGEGEGEGEGEGSSGEGEGEGAKPSSLCQTDVQCQVADAGLAACAQSADCGRNELCAPSTGNVNTCVLTLLPSDPPCEARSSKQLATFTAVSVEGQQFNFCASPNVLCDNGSCAGGVFTP
jgi:hypothetical protein